MSVPQFLPGVPGSYVLARLAAAGGKEIASGKFLSPDSSSALAVNCFGWFIDRPERLPLLKGLEPAGIPDLVDVEYCARFPWRGGSHPWLDAVVQTPTTIIGVESKRFEPFRDAKKADFSAAYDRPVWGGNMKRYETMKDRLRSGKEKFVYLDAAQLVKHAFGLFTQGCRSKRKPSLVYLFAEPTAGNEIRLTPSDLERHRSEIRRFTEMVSGDDVEFHSQSYREWLGTWSDFGSEIFAHGQLILSVFQP